MNSSKALLFVDDEPEILDILSDLFQDEGYNLYTATRVDEALDIIENNNVDFVLSDLKLPDSSGVNLLEKVKVLNPETVRVLTSGYLDIGFGCITEDKHSGTIMVSKPWDLNTLKQLVAEKIGA
ncbi:response regulator [bacterium]|nr:response regulator [bacterium]